MKRAMVILVSAILVLTLATGTAFAAKNHKKTKPTTPEVLVTDLPGTITGTVGPNEYSFDTGAAYGVIILDLGPAWYKAITLVEGAATVTGEIETSKQGAVEIGAHSVTQGGQTYAIKGEGKPPWAGGPGGHGKPGTAGEPDDD